MHPEYEKDKRGLVTRARTKNRCRTSVRFFGETVAFACDVRE